MNVLVVLIAVLVSVLFGNVRNSVLVRCTLTTAAVWLAIHYALECLFVLIGACVGCAWYSKRRYDCVCPPPLQRSVNHARTRCRERVEHVVNEILCNETSQCRPPEGDTSFFRGVVPQHREEVGACGERVDDGGESEAMSDRDIKTEAATICPTVCR